MAGSRRENHFFSSRLSDSDLLLFTYVPGQFFSRKLLAGLVSSFTLLFFRRLLSVPSVPSVPSFVRLLLCLAVLDRLCGGVVLPAVPLRKAAVVAALALEIVTTLALAMVGAPGIRLPRR